MASTPPQVDIDMVMQVTGQTKEAVQNAVDLIQNPWMVDNKTVAAAVQAIAPGMTFQPLDSSYAVVAKSAWDVILPMMIEAKAQYVAQTRDCDDFAFSMRGDIPLLWDINSIGLVIDYAGSHAYNMIVVPYANGDGYQALLVEPQMDGFVPASALHKAPYMLQGGQVMF